MLPIVQKQWQGLRDTTLELMKSRQAGNTAQVWAAIGQAKQAYDETRQLLKETNRLLNVYANSNRYGTYLKDQNTKRRDAMKQYATASMVTSITMGLLCLVPSMWLALPAGGGALASSIALKEPVIIPDDLPAFQHRDFFGPLPKLALDAASTEDAFRMSSVYSGAGKCATGRGGNGGKDSASGGATDVTCQAILANNAGGQASGQLFALGYVGRPQSEGFDTKEQLRTYQYADERVYAYADMSGNVIAGNSPKYGSFEVDTNSIVSFKDGRKAKLLPTGLRFQAAPAAATAVDKAAKARKAQLPTANSSPGTPSAAAAAAAPQSQSPAVAPMKTTGQSAQLQSVCGKDQNPFCSLKVIQCLKAKKSLSACKSDYEKNLQVIHDMCKKNAPCINRVKSCNLTKSLDKCK